MGNVWISPSCGLPKGPAGSPYPNPIKKQQAKAYMKTNSTQASGE